MATIRRRGDTYQVRWRGLDGSYRGCTVHTLDAARRREREIQAAHDRGREWEPATVRARARIEDVGRAYLDARRLRCRPNTIRVEGSHLEVFQRFAAERGIVALDEFSRATLDDFLGWTLAPANGQHGRARKPGSAARIVEAAWLLWRWAEDSERWPDVPRAPRSLDLPRSTPAPVVAPTWAEMDAAIGEAGGWVRQLATWLRFTGLRSGESMALDWTDVDMVRGLLTVRPEVDKRAIGRVVPLHPLLLDEIATWGKREGRIIKADVWQGEARAREAAKLWRAAGVREAAWKGHPWHAFRRGFKSGLLAVGANPDAVDYLQGHAHGAGSRGRYIDGMALPLGETLARVPAIGAGKVVPIARGQGGDKRGA